MKKLILALGWLAIFVSTKIASPPPLQAATMPLDFINNGQVIQIGSRQFIKVSTNLYQATAPLSFQQSFTYTGAAQTFIAPYAGTYKIELWGAEGGAGYPHGGNYAIQVTKNGAYTAGEIDLIKDQTLYIYTGLKPNNLTSYTKAFGGYNGGGDGSLDSDGQDSSGAGGGASDIRLVGGQWNDTLSLRSRIMVAAAAGGTHNTGGTVGSGGYPIIIDGSAAGGLNVTGELEAWTSIWTPIVNQTTGGNFGYGSNGIGGYSAGAGGGGGYWGGYPLNNTYSGSAAGGSSYISGHTGCVAITSATDQIPKSGCTTGTTDHNCSLHYSGKVFTNTVMIDGAGYSWTNVKGSQQQMPNPAGGFYATGVGHTGNGAARITLI